MTLKRNASPGRRLDRVPAALRPWVLGLESDDNQTRHRAIQSLAKECHPATAAFLARTLERKDLSASNTTDILQAFGHMRHPAAFVPICRLAREGRQPIRVFAVNALAHQGRKSIPVLKEMMAEDPDGTIRHIVANGLLEKFRSGYRAIYAQLDPANPPEMVGQMLIHLDHQGVCPPMGRLLELMAGYPEPTVRQRAARLIRSAIIEPQRFRNRPRAMRGMSQSVKWADPLTHPRAFCQVLRDSRKTRYANNKGAWWAMHAAALKASEATLK